VSIYAVILTTKAILLNMNMLNVSEAIVIDSNT